MRTLLLASALVLVACGSTTDPAPPAPVAPAPVAPAPVAPAPPAAPVVAPPPAAPAVAEGTTVLVNYHGLGFYYVGVVTAVVGGQLSILYADGDTETVAPAMARPDTLGAGTRGAVLEGGAYLPCTIETRRGHALGLLMADGTTRRWASIGYVRVAEADLPTGPATAAPPAAFGAPGSIVLARYSRDELWYEAVVGEVVGDSRRVVYADGASEDRPMDALRAGGISPGTAVEGRVRGTETVITGSVIRRIEHGVLIQPASGEPVWFSLANVRIRS